MFSISGGVVYHLRGARSSQTRWKLTRDWLTAHLNAWPTSESELIIIGPSAGYLIETEPLKRWKKIIAVDRDPWAKVLFKLRHPRLEIDWVNLDLIPPTKNHSDVGVKSQAATDPLRQVLEAHPKAAVLFSNCLGQLWLEDAVWAGKFFADLPDLLKGRSVFSVHDRLSIKTRKPLSSARPLVLDVRPQPDQLLKRIFDDHDWQGIPATDHEVPADKLFPSATKWSYQVWSVTQTQHHVLEAVWR